MNTNLNDLIPCIQNLALKLIDGCKKHKIDIEIVSTLRTFKEQEEIYAIGRSIPGKIVTNSKPGNSYHNFGLAFDVCPKVSGVLDWDRVDLFNEIGKIGKNIGLEWGGDFIFTQNKSHFHFSDGLSISKLLNGKRPSYPRVEKEDEMVLFAKIERLGSKGIIKDVKYWHENVKSGRLCFGDYVKELITNMANTSGENALKEAIDLLLIHNIITTPEYWNKNAIEGKKCNGEYVELLIKRYAKNMGL